jgi:Domain of unknown function (DUF4396)
MHNALHHTDPAAPASTAAPDPELHHGSHRRDSHHTHNAGPVSRTRLTNEATLHCLVGCAIGEFVGLAIGVSLGLNAWITMALATVLGFASGYTLGLWPLVRQGMSWGGAFRTIWLGETISIAVMELAMNFTDYHVGGVQISSVFSVQFWLGYAAALPAGFIAAWPINYWLLKRELKQQCH